MVKKPQPRAREAVQATGVKQQKQYEGKNFCPIHESDSISAAIFNCALCRIAKNVLKKAYFSLEEKLRPHDP